MHPRLRRLWLSWSWLSLGALLAMALGLGWLAQKAGERLAAPELQQASQLVGRAVAGDIERALGYQIPMDRLVAVNAWFAGLVKDNPMLGVLVLTDGDGRVLANIGRDPALQQEAATAIGARDHLQAALQTPSMYVGSIPLHARDGKLVGWLHVGSVAGALPWAAWWWSLAAVLGLSVLTASLLRRLVSQRLHVPLAATRAAVDALVSGRLPLLQNPPVRDPATHYQSVLAEHLHALRRRNDALLLKIGEVRATHFAPDILATLDDLAAPLAARQPTSQAGSSTAASGVAGSALRRTLIATLVTMLVLAACGYVLHGRYQQADQRRLLDNGAQVLQQGWQATLEQDRVQLSTELDLLLARPGMAMRLSNDPGSALDTPDDAPTGSTPARLAIAIFNLDGQLLGTSGQERQAARLDPLMLAGLRGGDAARSVIHGVWQDGLRQYRSGVVRRVELAGRSLVIMVARPLDDSVQRLQRRLQAASESSGTATHVAVTDLRGHPLDDADAALARQWTQHGRSDFVVSGEQPAMVVTLALNAPSGHALGTMLGQFSLPPGLDFVDNILVLLCVVLATACVAGLLLYLRAQFIPLALATRQLERIAEGDTDEQEPLQQSREARLLQRMVSRVAEKIDALEMLRRSRDRQGKRQARFIRQQMMQLAERLDEAARRGILEDLQRIEHARHPGAGAADATPSGDAAGSRAERIADEFGVLALGFQNLVSRVGQQYQELDRLVMELREALRTKTQFIALQQELEIARKMQLSILPRQFDANPQLSLHAMMQPAKEVGGDFYDFFNIDQHRVVLVVADVSGKGVPAAFFMAISRTLLRAVAPYADSAATCVSRVNDLLAEDNDEMMFVTLFYAILDTRDGSLTYVNAGHNPPFLMRADGSVGHPVATRGIALAVASDMHFEQGNARLEAGDGLFLYTDGITEAADPDEQLFGEPRLVDVLRSLANAPVESITHGVVDRAKQFEAGSPQADDITCLMVRYRGAP